MTLTMTPAITEPQPGALTRHAQAWCEVTAAPSLVFEHIDRPERLSAHMARRSWRLAGSSMAIETDAKGGRSVGSHIRLTGRMLGVDLYVECEVIQRDFPRTKTWETVGEPHLLVIGRYRMSANIEAYGDRSKVTISIDYALPDSLPERWLGKLFGSMYARWCVRQMVQDLAREFSRGGRDIVGEKSALE